MDAPKQGLVSRAEAEPRSASSHKKPSTARATNLTEIEVGGLHTTFTFADGHAYHDMPPDLQCVMNDLQDVWREARDTPVPRMEERFRRTLGRMLRSPILEEHPHYSLCPTASNSIDIVGAWLAAKGYGIGLLEPTFDNLCLLLKRRRVQLISIQESDLLELESLRAKIQCADLKALLVVSPNNPTGFRLGAEEFRALCELCAELDVTLIVDATFRFYAVDRYDEYRILEESSVKYIVIEDTGKTWPTQDTKVSLMAYSRQIADELRPLYEEVYLCHSNFSVALLNRLIEQTDKAGIEKIIWRGVMERRAKLEHALAGTALVPVATTRPVSALPVAWLDCSRTGLNDLQLVRLLTKFDVALLPGRFFYWNSQARHTNRVRVSLLRSDAMFERGLRALNEALHSLARTV